MRRAELKDILASNPVFVTGMGAWTPAGHNVAELWQSVLAARSPATSLCIDAKPGTSPVAVCAADTPENLPQAIRRMRRADRTLLLAVPAALEAWQAAGMPERQIAPDRIAVIVGCSRGTVQANAETALNHRDGKAFPSHAAHANPASISGAISSLIHATGPSFVVSAACASSAVAIATAAQLLLLGVVDVVLAGGSEAPLHPSTLAVLRASGILASHPEPAKACRPFDLHRTGTAMGEGAAFLVLESSRTSNADAVARLAGWGITNEPGERVGIRAGGEGLEKAMKQALQLAGLGTGGVGYLNAHGTGTVLNDQEEAGAIRRVLGSATPLISSTKAATGHCMGASAAIEAVIAIQAMRSGQAPPTTNCESVDPACDLDIIRFKPTPWKAGAVISNSSGFWGNHASLVFDNRL